MEAFEQLETISPSAEWSQALEVSLGAVKPQTASRASYNNYTAMLLLFVLVNMGFILNTVLNKSHAYKLHVNNLRNSELQIISNELLTHSTETSN